MDDDPPDRIRSGEEIARRALALFGVVAVSFGADRQEVLDWLRDAGLVEELSPVEAKFINEPTPSRQQIINASWYSERLIMLLWALNIADLPGADEQCDTAVLQDVLPPYADVSAADFLTRAKARCEDELRAMAEDMADLHWEARDAAINKRPPRQPVELGIIQERHYAINWITGYDGVPWDEVTTDT